MSTPADAPAPEFAPGDRVVVEAKFLAKSDAPIHRVPDATAWVKLDGNMGSTACSLSAVRAFSAAAAEPAPKITASPNQPDGPPIRYSIPRMGILEDRDAYLARLDAWEAENGVSTTTRWLRDATSPAAEPVSDDDRKRALALAATYEAMAGGLAVKPKDDDDASWDAAQAFEAIYRSDLRFTARALRAYAGGTRDD
jgi:hypothetical protein